MHQQAAYMFSDLAKTLFPSPAAVIGEAITVSAMRYLAFLHHFPVRLYSGGGLIWAWFFLAFIVHGFSHWSGFCYLYNICVTIIVTPVPTLESLYQNLLAL